MTTEKDALYDAMRNSFDAFARHAFKSVEPSTPYEWNWHMGCIAEHLEACRKGQIKRLIINVPPRTLKTYLVSVAFPAWLLGLEPHERIIATSYKFDLVKKMTRKCKMIMESDWYQECFKETRISKDQNEKHFFETTDRGHYYASAMSSVTGEGGNYVICDDPVNPDEALSDTIRTSTNETIRGTLFSRFNDSRIGRFILVMQRLHEDDPTGNLLKDGLKDYVHLKLPAEAKGRPVIITLNEKFWVMKKGELLFPARLGDKELQEKRDEMLDYNFVGQYLQEPVPLGGGEFNDSQINYYDEGGVKVKEMNIYIIVDPAGGEELQKKKKKKSDYTAYAVVGLHNDNNYYLLDMVRDKLDPTERVEKLFELHRTWNGLAGKPPKVGYEKYALMTDTHYIKVQQNKEGYRFPLVELGGAMEKNERIRRMLPDLKNGRWWFKPTILYTNYEGRTMDLIHELKKSEMATFPRARYDDMLDAITRIYDKELTAVFPKLKKKATSGKQKGYSSILDF